MEVSRQAGPPPGVAMDDRMNLTIKIVGTLSILTFFWACGPIEYSPVRNYLPRSSTSRDNHAPASLEARAANIINRMIDDRDEPAAALGEALARLPELNDGISPTDLMVLQTISQWPRISAPPVKELLGDLARENPAAHQFSGSLQGLFWMVENQDLPVNSLAGLNRRLLQEYAFREISRRRKTPEQILDYLAGNYTYILNRQSAQRIMEFFASKYGDCTEYSLLGGYLLSRQNIETYILTSRPSPLFNHVSIIYRAKDGYYLMDPSRVTVSRVLRRKKQERFLSPLDREVWRLMGKFDRIYGPEKNVTVLVGLYGPGVPFNLIPYDQYFRYIEDHGRENPDWFNYSGPKTRPPARSTGVNKAPGLDENNNHQGN